MNSSRAYGVVSQNVYVFHGRLKGQVCEVVGTSSKIWTLRSGLDPSQTRYEVDPADILVL